MRPVVPKVGAEKKAQWATWEAELRKTFSKEKARHNAALVKLEGEMLEAIRQQDEARAAVRQVAAGPEISEAIEPCELLNEEFDAAMRVESPDPWEADSSQDAVLQRALAATFTGNTGQMAGASVPTPAMATPSRATGVRPMTPVGKAVSNAVRAIRAPMPKAPPQSRMMPFPPPLDASKSGMTGTENRAMNLLVSDPYTAGLEQIGADAAAHAPVPGLGQSPSGGHPKTPKARQGVKESARPTGPVHVERPFPGFQEKVEAKRAALMAEVQLQAELVTDKTQRFCIHDDDAPEQEILHSATSETNPVTVNQDMD